MSIVYLAIQEGVYRHNILAVASTEHEAIDAGIRSIREEDDHYHTVEIITIEIGSVGIERQVCRLKWVPDEQKPVEPYKVYKAYTSPEPGKIHRFDFIYRKEDTYTSPYPYDSYGYAKEGKEVKLSSEI